MSATTKQKAIDHITVDFAGRLAEQKACLALLNYLFDQPEDALGGITFAKLSGIDNNELHSSLNSLNTEKISAEIIAAIQYFCGDVVPLLDVKFNFVDGDTTLPITNHLVGFAQTVNIFTHPVTGEPVDDFRDKIFISFMLSETGFLMRKAEQESAQLL